MVDAPWDFAGAYQAGSLGVDTWSVPGFQDKDHDALLALIDWVEKGKPVSIILMLTRTPNTDLDSAMVLD